MSNQLNSQYNDQNMNYLTVKDQSADQSSVQSTDQFAELGM